MNVKRGERSQREEKGEGGVPITSEVYLPRDGLCEKRGNGLTILIVRKRGER